ncbi:unnamed protein product [Lactuca saligna]|uniref:glycine--tRNA ligase n=1 Tax=Lactuca saligna TaxID=75948 RepID=A0AA36EQC3_LACSI|nr:unnamed protein product [Lactuca saligna]
MGKKRKHEVKDREEILRPRGGCIGAVVLFLSSRWYGFTLIWFREVISGKILQLESVTQSEAMRSAPAGYNPGSAANSTSNEDLGFYCNSKRIFYHKLEMLKNFQVESRSLTEPLWDTSTVSYPYPNNGMFVRDRESTLLSFLVPLFQIFQHLRLDSLVGLFGAGCQPSSTNDPFGLPRISYGLVQVLVEKDRNLDLQHALEVDASVKSLKIDVVTICEGSWFDGFNQPKILTLCSTIAPDTGTMLSTSRPSNLLNTSTGLIWISSSPASPSNEGSVTLKNISLSRASLALLKEGFLLELLFLKTIKDGNQA